MTLSKREKVLLVVLGTAVLLFLYFRFVFLPEGVRIAGLEAKYKERQELLGRMNSKADRMAQISSEVKKIDNSITAYKEKTSLGINVPDLLTELDKVADANQLLIDNIDFQGSAAAIKGKNNKYEGNSSNISQVKDVQGITGKTSQVADESDGKYYKIEDLVISFSFRGNYNDFINFIGYYETNGRVFIIDMLEINNNGDYCSGRLSLKAFAVNSINSEKFYNAGKETGRNNPFK